MNNKIKKWLGLILFIISFILIVIISVNLKFIGENNKKNDEVVITLNGNGITSVPIDKTEQDSTEAGIEIIDIKLIPKSDILINEEYKILVPGDTLNLKYEVENNSNVGVDISETIIFKLLNKDGSPFTLAPIENAFVLHKAKDIGYSFEQGYIVRDNAKPIQVEVKDNVISFKDIKRNVNEGTYGEDYMFIFKKDAGNIYQNLVIDIDITVEASNTIN